MDSHSGQVKGEDKWLMNFGHASNFDNCCSSKGNGLRFGFCI